MLLPSLTLMHLTGSNDMLQSPETEGPAITISATEGTSVSSDPIGSDRLQVQALLQVCFLLSYAVGVKS